MKIDIREQPQMYTPVKQKLWSKWPPFCNWNAVETVLNKTDKFGMTLPYNICRCLHEPLFS